MNSKETLFMNRLKKDGISPNAILFFLQFVEEFKEVAVIETTNQKLAAAYGINHRSIQRYIQQLAKHCWLIDKRILEKSRSGDFLRVKTHRYSLTEKTYDLISKYYNERLARKRMMVIE